MGEQIKLLRKHYKMTQTEFGQKIGVSRDVINNIENKMLSSEYFSFELLVNIFFMLCLLILMKNIIF